MAAAKLSKIAAHVRLRTAPYYLKRPSLWGEPLVELDPRTAVSHRWRYVYLRVPKAANSTVTVTLTDRFPEAEMAQAEKIDMKLAAARKDGMTHFSALSSESAIDGYFVFSFVRNPYHRALSAFLDKVGPDPDLSGGETEVHKRYRRFHGREIAAKDGGRISFLGFCRYLADGGERDNAHWMAQSRFLGLHDRIDFIGRVESLASDLDTVVARIAGEGQRVDLKRAGPPATRADEKVKQYFCDESRALIERTYAADFERLGYAHGLG
jgi:hypothetical protein